MAVKIFFCYAREDEELLTKLKDHLKPFQRQGLIEFWYDRNISAGAEWEQEITQHLNSAQIILLLVSPDFMASDYINDVELKRAIERHRSGDARIIPIILRYSSWQGEPLGRLQALPTDGKPVMSPRWYNLDEALNDAAEGIRKVAVQLATSQQIQSKQEKPRPIQPSKPRLRKEVIAALIGATTMIIAGIIGGIFLLHSTGNTGNSSATHTPTITHTPSPSQGTRPITSTPNILLTNEAYPPDYHDALNSSSTQKALWQSVGTNNSRCAFASDGYHVQITSTPEAICHEKGKSYQDFTMSIDMVLNGAGSGGLLFRDQDIIGGNGAYFFEINPTGQYKLSILSSTIRTLRGWISSPAIRKGSNIRNILQIIASGHLLTLYINGVYLSSITDQTFLYGGISLACFNAGEAIFSNLNVYLPH